MATTQQVTHFDLSPDFDLLIRPAHGGEVIFDPSGWAHYAWHVLIMCRDENLSLIWRTGTGAVKVDETTYQPTIPEARPILEGISRDLEDAINYPDLPDFLDEFGYEDARKAVTTHIALQRQLADFRRVFPLHIQHFIDTYRED